MDEKQILAQAKAIMDEFSKALDGIQADGKIGLERKAQVRIAIPKDADKEFIALMLENAPATKGDFILAEKKKW